MMQDYEFDLDRVQMLPESWGLDRIDEEALPMDGQYHYEHGGAGVDVYILDTGLYQQHIDFTTVIDWQHPRNVTCGYDAFADDNADESSSKGCIDTNGHGTHVAGIIGGLQNGVAKRANLISVKVHDTDKGCSLATVLAGLDYVMEQKMNNPEQPMITNISLGGPKCDIANDAVEALVDAGVVVVASAGNDAGSSCEKSPASSDLVITVSATDVNDAKVGFANFGLCINLFAPGHQITSAWIRDERDVARLSGTSMAAPHVAGGTWLRKSLGLWLRYHVSHHRPSLALLLILLVAAQYLEKYPHWSPHDVWSALQAHALRGLVTDLPPSTSNLLLNTGDLRVAL
jgi:serine protease